MTVTEHPAIHRHVENPIGMGKITADDAHDASDDELQRFSKGGAARSRELGDGTWDAQTGRLHWSTKRDEHLPVSAPKLALVRARASTRAITCVANLPSPARGLLTYLEGTAWRR